VLVLLDVLVWWLLWAFVLDFLVANELHHQSGCLLLVCLFL
jgi:hypothetical protein